MLENKIITVGITSGFSEYSREGDFIDLDLFRNDDSIPINKHYGGL